MSEMTQKRRCTPVIELLPSLKSTCLHSGEIIERRKERIIKHRIEQIETTGNTIMAPTLPFKLNNPDLFRDQALSGGQWVESKTGKRFDVYDPGNGKVWATAPDCGPDDVDAAVKSANEAFHEFRRVNPRTRAQWMLKWDQLIRENRDDLAQIVTHECGKPLFESQGELDYALGFTWWFAGEAERACITANRVYVQKGVYDRFAEMLAAKTKEIVLGHGEMLLTFARDCVGDGEIAYDRIKICIPSGQSALIVIG
ncbi:hypothetical protein AC579_10587 [Pseudocercospora musae]|uniref:Aldehyde dehydrogenase domain-containing protein n=1 Tax=Pseudocercospora musae TaxID=113226 RepID=A0A139ILL4_9PEZI|nr:hypothetical protein AC579_10587 [Pseudocercospora musae]